MSQEISVIDSNSIQEKTEEIVRWEAVESALAQNNYAKLNSKERMEVLNKTCASMGLNVFGQPFGFYKLKDGTVQLYAKRACAEQLSKIHKLSVLETSESFNEKSRILTVKVKMQDGEGRVGINIGCVWIGPNLGGEDLANQYMRCYTKATRRCILSLCGLGFLDETEVGDSQQNQLTDQRKEQAKFPKFASLEQRGEAVSAFVRADNLGTPEDSQDFRSDFFEFFTDLTLSSVQNKFVGCNITEERIKQVIAFCNAYPSRMKAEERNDSN